MLALLGFACLAAGYSIVGSVERVYFYYAYKLDTLTPGNQVIAPGCKDCNLDQFIKHISKDKQSKKIADEGLTGVIEIGQVVKDAKNNYASLLQKVGDRVVGKLSSSPKSPELAADFEKAKAGVYEAMKGVYNERMRAAVESFKPFPGEAEAFKVVEKEKGRGKSVDLGATVKANPGKTKAQIKAAWNEHIAGGHQENLSNLQKSITLPQELVCPAGPIGGYSPENKGEMERGVQNATEQLHEAMSKEIVRRQQRKLLIDMPKELKEKHMSLQPTADQYNAEFIKNITTEQMVGKYRTIYPGDPEVPGSQRDNSGEIRAKLRGFGDKLRETPPALPRYFDPAYILGQSRSLLSIENNTLSVSEYIRDGAPEFSETQVQLHTIHHTLQVTRLLNGKITEDELSTFPDQQIKEVNKFLTQPQVPPVPVETEDFENTYTYVSLVTGLSDAIVATLKDNADALGRVQVVSVGQSIMDLAERLKDMVGESDAHWAAAIEELRKKEAADGVVEVPPAKLKRTLARSSSGYRSEIAASMQ
ncbi:hypothetical protein MY4038_010282 [Beauveria bassiana]